MQMNSTSTAQRSALLFASMAVIHCDCVSLLFCFLCSAVVQFAKLEQDGKWISEEKMSTSLRGTDEPSAEKVFGFQVLTS